ncbi:MAG: hypothetical protein JWO03_1286 [Bacteroidetes bacterium]|nr:hypothetical protein [Bacteroidota bacterium]
MLRENNSDHHSIPHYYVYPGLGTVSVRTVQSCYSPEERMDFIMKVIKQEFEKRFVLDEEKMYNGSREMPHALARMCFYYFTRKQCPTLTLHEIARAFPALRQHHTTLLHAFHAIQNMIDTRDSMYYDAIMAIDEKLR